MPGDHKGNLSTIAAIGLTGLRTGVSVPAAIDCETMGFFVEAILAPTLKHVDIVYFDNCPIHKAMKSKKRLKYLARGQSIGRRIDRISIRLKTAGQK